MHTGPVVFRSIYEQVSYAKIIFGNISIGVFKNVSSDPAAESAKLKFPALKNAYAANITCFALREYLT